jgi:hypothetical protein
LSILEGKKIEPLINLIPIFWVEVAFVCEAVKSIRQRFQNCASRRPGVAGKIEKKLLKLIFVKKITLLTMAVYFSKIYNF